MDYLSERPDWGGLKAQNFLRKDWVELSPDRMGNWLVQKIDAMTAATDELSNP